MCSSASAGARRRGSPTGPPIRQECPRLARDVALALEYLGPAPAIVEAPAALVDALRATVSDTSRVTFGASEDGRGLRIRTADGALSVDASIERRLARAWPRLAIALAGRLEALP